MKLPNSSEAASSSVSSPGSFGGIAMEYSDDSGKKQGRQPQNPQQQQQPAGSYAVPQESRQQSQQRGSQQQQQWSAQQQNQQAAYAHPQAYAQRPQAYQQQGDMMAVAGHDQTTDYQLAAAQQAQHQQFLQQQGAHLGQSAAVGGSYSAGYLTNAQQYAATINYQQQLAMQQSMMASGIPPHQQLIQQHPMGLSNIPQQHQPFLQPKIGRLPADRPLIKLSVSLIDTYKHINTVYYEEREARRAARAKEKNQQGQGSNNNGWDDDNYDYIVTQGELFYGKYRIKERIGKGSFGQVVRAEDIETQQEVAIKIIKSKKPFLMQAKTEIELLQHLNEKDPDDQHNIVRLLTHFMYRNHQCLVFEMLSLNLYELLKNTQFGGVSLNLIRKFAKQVLKSLMFLERSDVDIIHCDLKPENILLRHPKKSGVKVIDFGSSCRSNKRMYSYIQSRFYRSPEVMLGLPYSVAIDTWSLGCILAEMHTGEPLFSGSDQFDQMQKIVKLLGMVPTYMLDQASDQHRLQFFEKKSLMGQEQWVIRQESSGQTSRHPTPQSAEDKQSNEIIVPSEDPIASLTEVIKAETNRKKKYPPSETGNSPNNYQLFVDLIYRMLAFDPKHRIRPGEALKHPFITAS